MTLRLPDITKAAALSMTPMPHQQNLAEKLEDSPGQIAYHGLGSGKSLSGINAADHLKLPLLAMVPAALRNNMHKEIANSGFKGQAQVLSYQEALNKMKDPTFVDYASKALHVIDEGHRTASEDSARRQLHNLPAARKLILTATPIRNHPSEISPLINAVQPGSLPEDPADFKKLFTSTQESPVSFFGALKGHKPGETEAPANMDKFRKAIRGKVDFFASADRTVYPSASESVVHVPMSDKQQAAYNMVMGKYPMLAYKIRHGLPPGRNENGDFQAFMSGPRQVVNHPASFHSGATDDDATKIQAAADSVESRHKKDKNYRGVVYSSFLDSGIKPMSRALDKRGIPHAVFTGEQNDAERRTTIENYNSGKVPVLLISGAGAEGLDLKGTKHMALLEPHWNEELINQVKGRAVRYKSHTHLPENERHVDIERFHSTTQPSWWDKLLGRSRGKQLSADEYVYERAKEKQALNQPFLDALKEEGSRKTASFCMTPDTHLRPGFLLDLDDTLTAGGDNSAVLPGRLAVLRRLKAAGYPLIGVTNRSCYTQDTTPLSIIQSIERTCFALEDLLDDVYFSVYPDPRILKPSPVMLLRAMSAHQLDPSNTVMVGDSPDDANAARAASVSYCEPDEFFLVGAPAFARIPACEPVPCAPEQPRWRVNPYGQLLGFLPTPEGHAAGLTDKINGAATRFPFAKVSAVGSPSGVTIVCADDVADNAQFAAWIDQAYEAT